MSKVTQQVVKQGLEPNSSRPKTGSLHLVMVWHGTSVLPLTALSLPGVDIHGNKLKTRLWTLCAQLTFPKSCTSNRSKASKSSLLLRPNFSQQVDKKVRMFLRHRNCGQNRNEGETEPWQSHLGTSTQREK